MSETKRTPEQEAAKAELEKRLIANKALREKDAYEQLKQLEDAELKPEYASFYEISDTIYEEIIKDGNPLFATSTNGSDIRIVHCAPSHKEGYVTLPQPLDKDEIKERMITLPDGIEDFGTVKDLINEIEQFLHKYEDVTPFFLKFSSWYILTSWIYDRLNTISYLRYLGPPGTGKTRCQNATGKLCYKPMVVSGCITPAPIYRLIQRWKGTLILDETDWVDSSEKGEIIKILNCGYQRGMPVVRCDVNNADEIRVYGVYGPKVLSSRQRYSDVALESRCMTEQMKVTQRAEIPIELGSKFEEEQRQLRRKLLMFRLKYYHKISADDVTTIDLGEELEPRVKQSCLSFAVLFKQFPEVMADFKRFLWEHQLDLVAERSATDEGCVVRSIFELMGEDLNGDKNQKRLEDGAKPEPEISPQMIADYMYNALRVSTTAAYVGKILSSLSFKTKSRWIPAQKKTMRLLVIDRAYFERQYKRYIPEFLTALTPITVHTGELSNSNNSEGKEGEKDTPLSPPVCTVIPECPVRNPVISEPGLTSCSNEHHPEESDREALFNLFYNLQNPNGVEVQKFWSEALRAGRWGEEYIKAWLEDSKERGVLMLNPEGRLMKA